jgi:hypothetical protein
MRRIVITCLTLVAAALLVLPAAAVAATKKKAPSPQITRVQPMRVSVGNVLTISGRNFKTKRTKNTVIFRGANGRTAFVKPRRATSRKLVLVVPASVARLLKISNSRQQPTRLKLRVLAGTFSKFTPRRLSPVVTAVGSGDGGPGGPGGPGGTPAVCNDGGVNGDHDGDLISNGDEANKTHTDPCLKDTDGDGVEDGFEYKSAIDLNDDEYQDPNNSLPYPGKRPYPNPLDPSDANTDYDRDVLTLSEEYQLWQYAISQGSAVRTLAPLYYSDGMQASFSTRIAAGPDAGRRVPTVLVTNYDKHQQFVNWAVTNGYRTVQLSDGAPWWDHGTTRNTYGLFDFDRDGDEETVRQPGYRTSELYYYDHDNDGYVSDDERDEDGDGLDNYEETHGRLSGAEYWNTCYAQEKPFPVQYTGTSATDPDTDGDGVLDGADDQDHDDIPNLLEVSRVQASGLDDRDRECKPADGLPTPPLTWHPDAYGRVNPFNPCLPASWSRTCDLHPGLDGGSAPFDGSPDWYALN